jgi:hypothetical protein
MGTLMTMGLVTFAVIIIIGVIRVIFSPITGFVNFLMQLMLIDWLFDSLKWVIKNLADIWDNV